MSDTLCPKNFIKRDLNISIKKKQSNEPKSIIPKRHIVKKKILYYNKLYKGVFIF